MLYTQLELKVLSLYLCNNSECLITEAIFLNFKPKIKKTFVQQILNYYRFIA